MMVGGAIASSFDCALAQITPDGTLSNNSRVTKQDNISIIEGGTTAGSNLFHSFEEFSVPTGNTAYFINNASDIQNIISRVTGKSASNIDGLIGANGTANLFLINPNGIIFRENAGLDIGGSFIASTANSVKFADGIEFSATNPQFVPLLTINVPVGLQFGAYPAAIYNNSSSSSSSGIIGGLQPFVDRTLALVGGDIQLDGGSLTLAGGRVELGGVAGVGVVGLLFDDDQLRLSFPDNVALADINFTNGTQVNLISGNANIRAKSFSVINGSSLRINTREQGAAANISILVDDSVALTNNSYIFSGVESKTVGNGGDINITTGSLSLSNGAQLIASTEGQGDAGSINIDTHDRVFFDGTTSNGFPSGAFSSVEVNALGRGGNVNITAGSLSVTNGAQVSARTDGQGNAGNLTVIVRDSVMLSGISHDGQAASGLTSAVGRTAVGYGGDITFITNGHLVVRDGAEVTVSNQGTGNAGRIRAKVSDIRLDNQGKLLAESVSGKGGDIQLQTGNLMLLRRNSLISATSGIAGSNGLDGNINIDTKFLVAIPSENSDIVATGFGRTPGSNVQINAEGIFGTQFRQQLTPESDIVATGRVTLNAPDVDLNRGLINLLSIPVDTEVAQVCTPGGSQATSKFIVTGRGGLPPNPGDALSTDAVQVDLITLNPEVDQPSTPAVSTNPTSSTPPPIIEAQGWVIDALGNVILTANAPTVTPHSSWQRTANCQKLNQSEARG